MEARFRWRDSARAGYHWSTMVAAARKQEVRVSEGNAIGREFDAILAEACRWQESTSRERPTLLYHYTDSRGLLGMLETNTIRATEAGFLNDSAELDYVYTVVSTVAERQKKRLQTQAARKLAARLARAREGALPLMKSVYVACFSQERDLLSQWRAYANDGLGYAIGLDPATQFQVGETRARKSWNAPRLVRVTYDDAVPGSLVDGFVAAVLKLVDRVASRSKRLEAFAADRGESALVRGIGRLASAVKNPGFREENEWRLVFENHGPGGTFESLGFMPSRFGLTPYVSLRVTRRGRQKLPLLPIRELVLGPKLDSAQAEMAAHGLLREYQYGRGTAEPLPIAHSDVSYR